MYPYFKYILDTFVKPAADAEITKLVADRDTNIAALEAGATAGGATGIATVTSFITTKVHSSNPFIAELETLAVPAFAAKLQDALTGLGGGIPEYYDAGIAFLKKEEAYL